MSSIPSDQSLYDQLAYYTLAHAYEHPEFIHQYIVDAFAAQTADAKTKPITITFALLGLYLHLEKKYTGRQVQLAHIELAKKQKVWPTFALPQNRGDVTVADVLKVAEGSQRDEMINKWCVSVWNAYKDIHQQVKDLVNKYLSE